MATNEETKLIYPASTAAIETSASQITLYNPAGSTVGVVSNTQVSLTRNGTPFLSQTATDTKLADSNGNDIIGATFDSTNLSNNTITISRGGANTTLEQSSTSTTLYHSGGDVVLNYNLADTGATIIHTLNLYAYGNDCLVVTCDENDTNNCDLLLARAGHNNILYQDRLTTTLSDSNGQAVLSATTTTQTLRSDNLRLNNCPTATTGTAIYVKGSDGLVKAISPADLKTLLGI